MNYEIFYTREAWEDLEEIYDYISCHLQEPETAKKLCNRIISAVKTLEILPLRNSIFEKEPWLSRGLRRMPVKNFLVFYTVNEQKRTVTIIRIMYGARDIENHL